MSAARRRCANPIRTWPRSHIERPLIHNNRARGGISPAASIRPARVRQYSDVSDVTVTGSSASAEDVTLIASAALNKTCLIIDVKLPAENFSRDGPAMKSLSRGVP